MLLDADDSQLVLVDYQARLMPVIFEHDIVVANAVRLARMARLLDVPVWGTAQNPDKLGQNLPEVQAAIDSAGGKTMAKMHFSAASDGLVEWLRPPARKAPIGGNARSLPKHLQKPPEPQEEGRSMIVIAGCEAHVCLMQTALELLEEEFDVWVVTDACSSRTERNRDAAFDRLAGAGAELVTTEMVAFEWLRTAEHELFREFLPLIK
ncbi:MAG: isochorismatase family protein [Pseudomonadota bacterium]|nr:isochorismatase family protein [Pseudomonadota bacterium]